MDTYEFRRAVPNRWKWWCKLRNHWRRHEHSVVEVFDKDFNIYVSYCEFCGSRIKYPWEDKYPN